MSRRLIIKTCNECCKFIHPYNLYEGRCMLLNKSIFVYDKKIPEECPLEKE